MNFDLLIVTHNRQDVLRLSLPIMLSQNQLPKHLIIVDSSDNHDEVAKLIYKNASEVNIDTQLIKSDPGIAYQRNLGLRYVESPIVFMPDDDSLWYAEYTDTIMKVYESDENEKIGSVCGAVSAIPPAGIFNGGLPYEIRWQDNSNSKSKRVLSQIIRFFQDPISIEYILRLKKWHPLSWFSDQNVSLCFSFSGFQASFRSHLIKDLGYDEILGRYSLYEDRELMLRMMDTHIPVVARGAKVYHYRSPEPRTSGVEWGVIKVLNRTYIICKHTRPGSLNRRYLNKYCFYLLLRSVAQIHTKFGRHRVIGTLRALKCVPHLLNATAEELPNIYLNMRKRCLQERLG